MTAWLGGEALSRPLSHWEREGPVDAVDGRVWGYGASQPGLGPHSVEHFRKLVNNLVVQEPEDEPAEAFDLALAEEVIAGLIVVFVDAAVEFDDHHQGFTGEVGEVAVDRMLAEELQAIETAAADRLPELPLRERLALAEIAGTSGSSFARHRA